MFDFLALSSYLDAASFPGSRPCFRPRRPALEVKLSRARYTLTLHGDINMGSRRLLEVAGNQLAQHCVATGIAVAMIEASEVQSVDADGLGGLVVVQQVLGCSGIEMQILNASAQLQRVSAISGLDPNPVARPVGLAPLKGSLT